MELLTIITMLALLEYLALGYKVGMARGEFNVVAPSTTGHEIFERYYRVHYNTLEQLMLFLPSFWAFGYYFGQYWAAPLGLIFLLGRAMYAVSYVKDPKSRGAGMMLSFIPSAVMIVGAIIGALMRYF